MSRRKQLTLRYWRDIKEAEFPWLWLRESLLRKTSPKILTVFKFWDYIRRKWLLKGHIFSRNFNLRCIGEGKDVLKIWMLEGALQSSWLLFETLKGCHQQEKANANTNVGRGLLPLICSTKNRRKQQHAEKHHFLLLYSSILVGKLASVAIGRNHANLQD